MTSLIYYLLCRRSILGPLLCIIFLCDLFDFEENVDIVSYVDDNTPYCASHDIQSTINTLKDLFDWFSKDSTKANADKCHLLLSENTKHVACINQIQIENYNSEKLLGVTIDSYLKFDIRARACVFPFTIKASPDWTKQQM